MKLEVWQRAVLCTGCGCIVWSTMARGYMCACVTRPFTGVGATLAPLAIAIGRIKIKQVGTAQRGDESSISVVLGATWISELKERDN